MPPRNWLRRSAVVAACAAAAMATTALVAPASADAATGDGSPADSNITYVGRWDRTDPTAYDANWAGPYLRVGFTGSTVQLRQRNAVDLYASIDGRAFTAYTKVAGTVNLTPTPLAAGNHTLVVAYKQVAGVYNGDDRFLGLLLDAGAHTYRLPARPQLIEFVGDSITAGATSSMLALTDYAWLVGEQLSVEHTQIAVGGWCLSETTDGCAAHERRYFLTNGVSGTTAWDFSRYQADEVVINLGTNDKSHGVSGPDFQAKYTTFLAGIRAKYPNATLIALRTFIGRYAAETQAAVKARTDAGDHNVFYVDTTGWLPPDGLSDSVHPNDAGHRAIAARLAPVLTTYLGGTAPIPTGPVTLVNQRTGKALAPTGSALGATVAQTTATGAANQRWTVVDAGGGYTKIVNQATGMLLDVKARSDADGAAVVQYRDNGGANQQWQLLGAGAVRKLVNRNSGKVLDISGGASTDGAAAVQWTDDGGTDQLWRLAPA